MCLGAETEAGKGGLTLGSSPRSFGWGISLRSSMEQTNSKGCSPGRTPQGPECSGAPGVQVGTHRGLEYNPEKILPGSDYGLGNPPALDPKLPHLSLRPAPPTLSDLGQPRKSPLTGNDKKYLLMKQRGYYSDILSPGTLDQLGVSMAAIPYQASALPLGSVHPSFHPSPHQSVHLFI